MERVVHCPNGHRHEVRDLLTAGSERRLCPDCQTPVARPCLDYGSPPGDVVVETTAKAPFWNKQDVRPVVRIYDPMPDNSWALPAESARNKAELMKSRGGPEECLELAERIEKAAVEAEAEHGGGR